MNHTGTIEDIRTKEKNYSIRVDNIYFSGFYDKVTKRLPEEIKIGNTIEIEYTQNGNYNNISKIKLIEKSKPKDSVNLSIRIGGAMKSAMMIIVHDDTLRQEVIKGDMTNYERITENIFKANATIETELRKNTQ
jgi:hypothetical protein